MKFIILVFLSILLFNGCSSNDTSNLEVYNPEAFAYDLEDGWEVNSTVRIKGFKQNEENKNYTASFSYSIDLITPSKEKIESLISKTQDFSEFEQLTDVPLEAQFELDSTYVPGKYTIVWNVTDVATNNTGTTSIEFILNEE